MGRGRVGEVGPRGLGGGGGGEAPSNRRAGTISSKLSACSGERLACHKGTPVYIYLSTFVTP